MASTPVWRAFDSNLIDSVRSKPVLYNTRLKEFRNNKIKENTWKAVAAELEESGRHQDRCYGFGDWCYYQSGQQQWVKLKRYSANRYPVQYHIQVSSYTSDGCLNYNYFRQTII